MGDNKSSGVGVIVELLVGMFTGVMGVGHIFAGKFGVGILVMLCYWVIIIAQNIYLVAQFGLFAVVLMLLLDPVFWIEKIVFAIFSAYAIHKGQSDLFGNIVFLLAAAMAVVVLSYLGGFGPTIIIHR
jgi:hypothetical protein